MLSKCHPAFILICIWKGDENTPKEPYQKKSTKWNNILIRLEHAHRSLTTRTPLKTPFNRHESSSKSLSTSRVCTAVFKTEIKNGVESSSVKLSDVPPSEHNLGKQKTFSGDVSLNLNQKVLCLTTPFHVKMLKNQSRNTMVSHNYIRSIWHFEVMKCIRTIILEYNAAYFWYVFRFFGVYTLVIHYSLNIFTLL